MHQSPWIIFSPPEAETSKLTDWLPGVTAGVLLLALIVNTVVAVRLSRKKPNERIESLVSILKDWPEPAGELAPGKDVVMHALDKALADLRVDEGLPSLPKSASRADRALERGAQRRRRFSRLVRAMWGCVLAQVLILGYSRMRGEEITSAEATAVDALMTAVTLMFAVPVVWAATLIVQDQIYEWRKGRKRDWEGVVVTVPTAEGKVSKETMDILQLQAEESERIGRDQTEESPPASET